MVFIKNVTFKSNGGLTGALLYYVYILYNIYMSLTGTRTSHVGHSSAFVLCVYELNVIFLTPIII